ncbi:MAG: ATP-binding protein [Bacillota bacterium]
MLKTLSSVNSWWQTGVIPAEYIFAAKRNELLEIINLLTERRITVVSGPRRVGKSILLFNTIEHLLAGGVTAKRILHFSGDDVGLFLDGSTIIDIISTFCNDVLGENIAALSDMIYIFIDEIHFIKNWQQYLKNYFDRRLKIKFIVSGSSSTHLFDGAIESLMGRCDDVYVFPLSFREFIQFDIVYNGNNVDISPTNDLHLSDAINNPAVFHKTVIKLIPYMTNYEAKITLALNNYLLTGGYPEWFETKTVAQWQRRLEQDIVQKSLYRDIVSIHGITNPEYLEKILHFIAANQGQTTSYSTIAQTVGADSVTVTTYIRYLCQACLLGLLENYSANAGKIIRKNRKLFVYDSGICNALTRTQTLSPEIFGQAAENCVRELFQKHADYNHNKLYYWRDGDKEVDLIADTKNAITPIEIKYRNEIKQNDLKGLTAFENQYSPATSLIITKQTLINDGKRYYYPLWLFALAKYQT